MVKLSWSDSFGPNTYRAEGDGGTFLILDHRLHGRHIVDDPLDHPPNTGWATWESPMRVSGFADGGHTFRPHSPIGGSHADGEDRGMKRNGWQRIVIGAVRESRGT